MMSPKRLKYHVNKKRESFVAHLIESIKFSIKLFAIKNPIILCEISDLLINFPDFPPISFPYFPI